MSFSLALAREFGSGLKMHVALSLVSFQSFNSLGGLDGGVRRLDGSLPKPFGSTRARAGEEEIFTPTTRPFSFQEGLELFKMDPGYSPAVLDLICAVGCWLLLLLHDVGLLTSK